MLQKSYNTKCSALISRFIESKNEFGFTAVELSEYLNSHGLNVNKTTVYRNLDKLTEAGELVKLKSLLNDGFIYQNAKEEMHCKEHIHFQCKKCGSVIHLADEETLKYLQTISESLGAEIDFESSGLYGVCSKCRKK